AEPSFEKTISIGWLSHVFSRSSPTPLSPCIPVPAQVPISPGARGCSVTTAGAELPSHATTPQSNTPKRRAEPTGNTERDTPIMHCSSPRPDTKTRRRPGLLTFCPKLRANAPIRSLAQPGTTLESSFTTRLLSNRRASNEVQQCMSQPPCPLQ